MTRHAIFLFVAAAVLGFSMPAIAQDDDTQAIIDQCSNPLPDAVDACLERARVAEETRPDKDLQQLVAHLIELEARAPTPPQDGNSPATSGVASDDNAAPAIDTAEPQAPEPDNSKSPDAPPDEQAAPPDMSAPDNIAPKSSPADTEPPAPPAGSPHS